MEETNLHGSIVNKYVFVQWDQAIYVEGKTPMKMCQCSLSSSRNSCLQPGKNICKSCARQSQDTGKPWMNKRFKIQISKMAYIQDSSLVFKGSIYSMEGDEKTYTLINFCYNDLPFLHPLSFLPLEDWIDVKTDLWNRLYW